MPKFAWRALLSVVLRFALIGVWFAWGHRWLDALAYAGPPPTYTTAARWNCALSNLTACAPRAPFTCDAHACAWAGRAIPWGRGGAAPSEPSRGGACGATEQRRRHVRESGAVDYNGSVAPQAPPREGSEGAAPPLPPRVCFVASGPLDRRARAFAFGVLEYGSDREHGQLVLDADGLVASGHVRFASNASATTLWGELRVPVMRQRYWIESLIGWYDGGASWDYWFVHATINFLVVAL